MVTPWAVSCVKTGIGKVGQVCKCHCPNHIPSFYGISPQRYRDDYSDGKLAANAKIAAADDLPLDYNVSWSADMEVALEQPRLPR